MQSQRFEGKTVVVTGASSGIGVGIARRFSAEGAHVVLAARRKQRLDELAAELPSALAVTTDVTRREDFEELVRRAVERFGSVDVLVSNAGTAVLGSLEDTTPEDWRLTMATDVDSCFFGAQAARPHLAARRGCIVQIASASGLGGDRRLAAYNAAKGAVVNLGRSLAFDLGEEGIRVNTIAPSLTLDDESAARPEFAAMVARSNERRALRGHATPEDIGAAAAFLASDDARRITGAVLPVDGGITAHSGQPDLF